MEWKELKTMKELETALKLSYDIPVLIFKHSTRCSISATALSRLERQWNPAVSGKMVAYYLDLLNYRPLSNYIAELTGIQHESPQAFVFRNGICVYNASHLDIGFAEIAEAI